MEPQDAGKVATTLPATVASASAGSEDYRNVMFDNGISYVEYVRGPVAADKLVVSFVNYGMNDRSAPGFAENVMRKLGYDVLAVKAGRNNWFQDLSLEAMSAIVLDLPSYQSIVTYGSSMGGYGAIYFADAVNATKSIAISPQVSIDPELVPFEPRWRHDGAHIEFQHRPLVEGLRSTRAEHYVIYDPTTLDARHVDMMRGATEAIRSIRVPFSGHPSGFMLAETGALSPLLRGILDDNPAPIRSLIRAGRRRSPSYFASLAARARELGHNALAMSAFEQVIALSDRTDIMMTYSQFLLSQGLPKRALAVFETAERSASLNAHDIAFKAHLLELNGDERGARAAFNEAIRLQPDFIHFYLAERRLLVDQINTLERTSEMLDAALKKKRALARLEDGGVDRPPLNAMTILRYVLISLAMVALVVAIARFTGVA